MKDRIKKIIDYKGISAGELADLLDVQRSNVSHILNGRNKPGAVFIERFLLTFPDVNARWLLTGKEDMLNRTSNSSIETTSTRNDNTSNNIDAEITGNQFKNKIEKVILLHSDGTFTSYTPN
ncbi:Bacteriophage CI repressor helix-turn-helix domain-containing protein [Tangfeifania diversioriginum]|uniref:Bacteriophage CI repressor helix-turn-helix domain-containing protein n=1 Tax=Tangfeifania diversioriginum TaxID=1168035 RepID=A0A1M6EVM4_9BACT|nr:helix-turn-helix transcriptional regulator [Tangfeifania diversioriginum]SHI89472.1 Bacteriophage CI repressor helix-turn-helix domain-containing protein [Tangfeifania diversioriginum]